MKIRHTALALITVLATMLAASGCDDNEVGRICFIGEEAETENQAIIASPALECQSRTCLLQPLGTGVTLPDESEFSPLCTAECETDDDCDAVPETPCQTGFTCAIPVVVGPFCCRKLCICRDYIVVPEEGVSTPAACEPSDPANTCINLPGRI